MSCELQYLIDATQDDGWFYIINKTAILVTEIDEIVVGAKVQFLYPENATKPKVRKGVILQESENETVLQKEMDKRCRDLEKSNNKKNHNQTKKEQEKKNVEATKRKLEKIKTSNILMAKELHEDMNNSLKKKPLQFEEILDNALSLTDKLFDALYHMKMEVQMEYESVPKEHGSKINSEMIQNVDGNNKNDNEMQEEVIDRNYNAMSKIDKNDNETQKKVMDKNDNAKSKNVQNDNKMQDYNKDKNEDMDLENEFENHMFLSENNEKSKDINEKIGDSRNNKSKSNEDLCMELETEVMTSLTIPDSQEILDSSAEAESLKETTDIRPSSSSDNPSFSHEVGINRKDSVSPESLWMMKCKASDCDNVTVIELVNNSGVYINKHGLKRAITRSNTSTVLARSILVELFKNDALA
ncbi:probable serine/threonine-protein kinase DDB_G0283337, partial [Leptopilina heterotoma]|uniref:probable serine/threonine-protein kinase DDB_G0283337 n=1 Tax=Leptopilina heterotoma TaxID=63436 RepID=UPI001CA8286A